MDGEWYKLSSELMKSCCCAIKDKILSKIGTLDMQNFSLQISRLSNIPWDTLEPHDVLTSFQGRAGMSQEEHEECIQKHEAFMMTKPSVFSARIEIEYVVSAPTTNDP
jgi:hypothetical protein